MNISPRLRCWCKLLNCFFIKFLISLWNITRCTIHHKRTQYIAIQCLSFTIFIKLFFGKTRCGQRIIVNIITTINVIPFKFFNFCTSTMTYNLTIKIEIGTYCGLSFNYGILIQDMNMFAALCTINKNSEFGVVFWFCFSYLNGFNSITNWLMLIPGVFCILISITLIVYQTIRFTNW